MLQFKFLDKNEICDLGKAWSGYRLAHDGGTGLDLDSYKDGVWESGARFCHPPQYHISQYDTTSHKMMVFIQEIAEAIGAELVVVRDTAYELKVEDPNHPERKVLVDACVAFARPSYGQH